MELHQLKNQIQDSAVEKWITKTQKKGTVESITGSGKTFIFLKALYTMPRDNKEMMHLFLAETVEREKDLAAEIEKFNAIFNVDVHRDYNLHFYCYQTVYKWQKKKFGLVCCDEIHDQLTPAYVMFHLGNKCEAVLGLSAKINPSTHYSLKRHPELRMYFGRDMVNKMDILERIAPICFKYSVDDGQKDGTTRKLNIYVVKHKLDDRHRILKAGNATKCFYQTEREAYDYATVMFNKAIAMQPAEGENMNDFEEKKNAHVIRALHRRSTLLYTLHSKEDAIKYMMALVKGKSIVFGNNLDSLNKITPGRVMSSRNKDDINDLIRRTFEEGNLRTIGSFKKLKQGANLPQVDNCFIKDYYSSEVDFIQRVGRLRENSGKIGHVFVMVTENTQEVSWFNKMIENSKEYNYILCNNYREAIDEYNKDQG